MVNSPTTASLRAYAKHRGLSASWIHRLCVQGTLTRDGDGRLDIAESDAILDQRRGVAHPGRLQANEQRRQRLREAAVEAVRQVDESSTALTSVDDAGDEARKSCIERAITAVELRIAEAQSRFFVQARKRIARVAGNPTALEAALDAFESDLLNTADELHAGNVALLARLLEV
jgi:hypothetical protein